MEYTSFVYLFISMQFFLYYHDIEHTALIYLSVVKTHLPVYPNFIFLNNINQPYLKIDTQSR